MPGIPPFCMHHLAELEPWVDARAKPNAKPNATAAEPWIEWARRNAQDAEAVRRMLGARPLARQGP